MTPDETDAVVRQLISGDPAAAAALLARAMTSTEPLVLIAAALLDPGSPGFLARAVSAAERPADRQLTALAAAHLAGDPDLVSALAREHLLDHPDSVLAAWIAAGATTRTTTRTSPRAGNAPAPTPKELS
jgi:DNA-binding GntR family transcriptional regulator